jgi:hypothetical protein
MQRLLREQAGVVAVSQGVGHGWSRQAMHDLFISGRWGHGGRGVYITHTGRLTYEERIFSGLVACGEDAVASHETALWLADRSDAPPKAVHVTIPTMNHRAPAQPHLYVHRSRSLSPDDVHPARHPRQVTVERAVLDCVRIAGTDDQAVSAIARTVQRGLTTAERLQVVVQNAATVPRRRLLLDALALAGTGAHSTAEVRYHQQGRIHGLPPAECQIREVIGGAMYLDAKYRRHPGRPVVVEIDGRLGHFDVRSWRRDMLRDAAQVVAGDVVLRLPALFLFTDPGQIMVPVAAVLRNEGWTGDLRRCRNQACSCHHPDKLWSVAS